MQPPHDPQHNPYSPPQGTAPGDVQAGQRPKWWQFATIATMTLGGLGVAAGIWAPLNLIIAKNNPMMKGFPGTGASPPPEMVEFQEKIMAASLPEVTALIGVVNLATGAWALWAALQLYKLQPGAREKFRNAVLALGAYELVAMMFNVIIQARVISVMDEFMATIMRSGSGAPPPGFEETMGAAMKVAMMVGIFTALLWGGCKIGFSFWVRGYAGKREVVAYAGE